jgi:hypothetical protein
MKVVCAWCQKEGRPALIREEGSDDAPFESHGICDVHSVKLLHEIRMRLRRAWSISLPEGAGVPL